MAERRCELRAEGALASARRVQLAVMRRIFRSARHHSIPPYIQDVLYKILVSGHSIGRHKCAGTDGDCARCAARGRTRDDTLE